MICIQFQIAVFFPKVSSILGGFLGITFRGAHKVRNSGGLILTQDPKVKGHPCVRIRSVEQIENQLFLFQIPCSLDLDILPGRRLIALYLNGQRPPCGSCVHR